MKLLIFYTLKVQKLDAVYEIDLLLNCVQWCKIVSNSERVSAVIISRHTG